MTMKRRAFLASLAALAAAKVLPGPKPLTLLPVRRWDARRRAWVRVRMHRLRKGDLFTFGLKPELFRAESDGVLLPDGQGNVQARCGDEIKALARRLTASADIPG